MQIITARAALYSVYAEEKGDVLQSAEIYCTKQGYFLEGVYYDIDSSKAMFADLQDAIDRQAFQVLLLPSFDHIYKHHLGHVLNFLIDALAAGIEVICLDPQPTRLCQQGLMIVPHTQTPQAANLEEIVHCLRSR